MPAEGPNLTVVSSENKILSPKEIQNSAMESSSEQLMYDRIEFAFGVAITAADGLATEFSTSASAEAILKLQGLIRGLNFTSNKVDISFQLDEIIMEALGSIKPRKDLMDVGESHNSLSIAYSNPNFESCLHTKASATFNYLLGLYNRCFSLVKQNNNRQLSTAFTFALLLQRLIVQFSLFLRGLLCANCDQQDVSIVFARALLLGEIDRNGLLTDLIECCKNQTLTDLDALDEIFTPVLGILRTCALMNASNKRFDDFCQQPFDALSALVNVKLEGNLRPIAELIASRPDFCPTPVLKEYAGREVFHTSFLGPFLSLSVAGSQSPLYDFCLDSTDMAFKKTEEKSQTEKEVEMADYRSKLGVIRIKMHSIVHALVVNSTSRLPTLDYIARLFNANRKLSQLQAEYDQLANCTGMLNLFSVLLDMSEKVAVEKVQDDYTFHPNCRLNMSEETRINMDTAGADKYSKSLDLSYTPNFNTECFHLTIAFMQISINTMANNYVKMQRHLYQIRKQVRETEEQFKKMSPAQIARAKAALQRAQDLLQKFTVSSMSYECLICDIALLDKCTIFVNKFLRFMLRSLIPKMSFDARNNSPSNVDQSICRFMSFPESFLETAIDFLHMLITNRNQQMPKVFLKNMGDYPKLLLHLLVNLSDIKNPFLASKIVDILFYVCPNVNPGAIYFYNQIMNDPMAVEHIFPCLVKFYADVESTGSHTEFYDKFNIRRNIQSIFQQMWSELTHRNRMIQFAGESSPNFYRFINMVINDTTFLLDESLDKLKKIHEIEAQMANEAEWNRFSDEEKRHKSEMLTDAKHQVKLWLQLGRDTMELFVRLTHDAPHIFRQEALGERVAAMLNNQLIQICGPKCSQLKVHDAEMRFNWNPRNLAVQIIQIYTNLSSELFAKQIAQDERSYTPGAFTTILNTFRSKPILPVSQFELFKNLAEQAQSAYEEKAKFEEQFEDEIPDEFRDAILYTLMSDPVTLPSGHVVDRKNILRHLLSDPNNPFTRQPLREDELVPNDELKAKIKSWMTEVLSRQK